jgi:transcriptional regulator with XRE-family HTH domain
MALHDYSGERLKAMRKRARLTQEEASRLTGVCENTISRGEAGRNRPQTGTLDKLCNLYAIRIQQLRNQEGVFKEKFSGGYIPCETVIGFGSVNVLAGGNKKEAPYERPVPTAHGVQRVQGKSNR